MSQLKDLLDLGADMNVGKPEPGSLRDPDH